jgi:RHS repeat-associated protein
VDTDPDDGSYTWTVPSITSVNCLFRVKNGRPEAPPVDESDNSFQIGYNLSMMKNESNGGINRAAGDYTNKTGNSPHAYTVSSASSVGIVQAASYTDTYYIYSSANGPYGDIQKTWNKTYDPKQKFSHKEREVYSGLDYFGARYYFNTSYRFNSVDPIMFRKDALVNHQLWNLYAYCRNNPINRFDSDGREFVVEGSKDFVKDFNTAINYLQEGSKTAKTVISKLDKFKIGVSETSGKTKYGSGNIQWNPKFGIHVIKTGKNMSSSMHLFHEILHAYHDATDKNAFNNRSASLLDFPWTDEEEKYTITVDETKAAKELREPVRYGHANVTASIMETETVHSSLNKE